METMVYIALLGTLMGGAVIAAYQLLEGGGRNETAVRIQEEGTFINRKINWALTGASATVVSAPNVLTITRPDLGAESPLVITGDGMSVTLARNGSAPAILNSDRFSITNMTFSLTPAAGGRPSSITASFQVSGMPFTFRKYLRK